MSIDEIINRAVEIRFFINDLLGSSLFWFQISSVLISGLLLCWIAYFMIKANYFGKKIEDYMDIHGIGNLTKRKSLKGWEQIKKRIKTSVQQEWKLAVLEADTILNEILKMAGYLGADLSSKLEILTIENLSNLDEIKKAHLIARQIMKDPGMELKKEDAIIALKSYKKSFIELNLLEE